MIDFKEKIRQYSEKSENEVLQYLFNYWGFEISEQTDNIGLSQTLLKCIKR